MEQTLGDNTSGDNTSEKRVVNVLPLSSADGNCEHPEKPVSYQWKSAKYSSHSLLLGSFPTHSAASTVLDVGCGSGYLALELAGRGFDVIGIEKPGVYVGEAFKSVNLIEHDLEKGLPPNLTNHFSYIVCADVLEHLVNPVKLLSGLRSRLAPGGVVVASLPNSGHFYFRLNVLIGRFPKHERGLFDRTHLHFYTLAGWKDVFTAAGLKIVTSQSTALPFELVFPRFSPSALRALESIYAVLTVCWKRLFAYQFVITAKPHEDTL